MLNNFAKHLAKINENQPEILQKYILYNKPKHEN